MSLMYGKEKDDNELGKNHFIDVKQSIKALNQSQSTRLTQGSLRSTPSFFPNPLKQEQSDSLTEANTTVPMVPMLTTSHLMSSVPTLSSSTSVLEVKQLAFQVSYCAKVRPRRS